MAQIIRRPGRVPAELCCLAVVGGGRRPGCHHHWQQPEEQRRGSAWAWCTVSVGMGCWGGMGGAEGARLGVCR